jgi:hypothetical protein
MTEELERGDIVTDGVVEGNEKMIVLEATGEKANEYPYTWDHKMNPVMVADADNNPEEFAEDLVFEVVYIDSLNDRHPEALHAGLDEVDRLIDENQFKSHAFPRGRLEKTGEVFWTKFEFE